MTILIILISSVVLLLVSGLFIKKDFFIERSMIIHQPKQTVFNFLKLLKNSEQFNKWTMTDPSMKKTLTGTDGTEGFVYAWDSTNKNVGAGAQEIIKITEGERIDYELRFERPFKGTSYSFITTTATRPDQTNVTWTFHGTTKYPFNIMHSLLNLSKVLGNDLQTSLSNLKNILERH